MTTDECCHTCRDSRFWHKHNVCEHFCHSESHKEGDSFKEVWDNKSDEVYDKEETSGTQNPRTWPNELGDLVRKFSPELREKGWAWLADFIAQKIEEAVRKQRELCQRDKEQAIHEATSKLQ